VDDKRGQKGEPLDRPKGRAPGFAPALNCSKGLGMSTFGDVSDRRSVPEPIAGAGSADTRRSIMAVAERLFREIGYRKTTVADIAKALRMSPANVYRFFDSKKAINEAVAERLLGEAQAAVECIAADTGLPAPARLRAMLKTMNRMSVQLFTADRRMHDMVDAAMVESWDVVHCHIVRMDDILHGLVAEGVAAGQFRAADPLVAARCIQSAMLRFCHPALIVQCADEPGPSIDDMCDFILASLREG